MISDAAGVNTEVGNRDVTVTARGAFYTVRELSMERRRRPSRT